MVFGTLELRGNSLKTHNDVYVLDGISLVSTRRPFLSSGLSFAGLLTLFGAGTIDLLYAGELLLIIGLVAVSAAIGLCIGQLRLVSRDLRGSPMGDAVYGTYGHLKGERLRIADAVQRARGGMSAGGAS
ncbi:MAG: hypothetical protein AAF943_11525 [Pseudomonadota bacterium]